MQGLQLFGLPPTLHPNGVEAREDRETCAASQWNGRERLDALRPQQHVALVPPVMTQRFDILDDDILVAQHPRHPGRGLGGVFVLQRVDLGDDTRNTP